LARFLRQTQSKDLLLGRWIHGMNLGDTTLVNSAQYFGVGIAPEIEFIR